MQYTTTTYASLADLWAAYERTLASRCDVTVRWEDAALLAPNVVRASVLASSSSRKSRVREWSAWTRGRYAGMERGDLAYAQRVLPPQVVRRWGYMPVPVVG